MTRSYSNFARKRLERVEPLLNRLADKSTDAVVYQESMFQLGVELGQAILSEVANNHTSAYLACTAEDADFLAKGILTQLETNLETVAFACLWNQRFSPFDVPDLTVAPIVKEYREPINQSVDYLVVAKSIISSGCVVRTNLVHLIESVSPEVIFITAPVIHNQSEQKLKNEFEPAVYSKFRFIYFAQDSDRTPTGEVIPGIGGYVYERLGIQEQVSENRYIPALVKTRRAKLANV